MKKAIIAIFLTCLLCSCAPTFKYEVLQSTMKAGNCPGAAEFVKNNQKQYGKKAQLLFMLDSGMINLQCGNYDLAGKHFSDAEGLAAQLWTKSITKGAASMVTNDLIMHYGGEDFERAMINLFSAISYIKKGEYDEAMTDCRRLDTLLNEYNNKHKKKNVYKEDALGRYISGVLSEADREYSEAYIYYYEAFKAFQNYNSAYGTATPAVLFEDLLRVAGPADRLSEARALMGGARNIKYLKHKKAKRMGKVVLIHLNGKGPKKMENKYTVRTQTGPVSIAFPKYVSSPPVCHESKLIVKSDTKTYTSNAVLFEDINKIAHKSLADRKVRTTAKAIARAVAKQAVVNAGSREIEKKYGAGWGLAAKIVGKVAASATEKADTRAWRTLPGEINVTRTFVPPGNYQVLVENCHGSQQSLDSLSVKAGETKFVVHYSIY